MEIRDKNPMLAGLIKKLDEKGRQEKAPIWESLAERLNRPRRRMSEVNLFSLERHASGKETVVVPGLVLGAGDVSKPLIVVALRFSRIAEEKIRKAGGKCMSIEKFMEEKAPKGARIMG